jgi:hypothetical protein
MNHILRSTRQDLTFHDYVLNRRYDFGRGSRESWNFIAYARGDPSLLNVNNWRELRAGLERRNLAANVVQAGRAVWQSYLWYRGRLKREGYDPR